MNFKNLDKEELEIQTLYKGATRTQATYLLAKLLVAKYHIVSFCENKKNEVYTYENGKYTKTDTKIVYAEIQRILQDKTDSASKSETYHKVIDFSSDYTREIFESAPRNLINLKNGVYNFESGELLESSPEYKFLYQFSFDYKKEAECPVIQKFLSEVLQSEDVSLMQEIIGYLFYRKYSYKKSFILVGEKDTGKTTLMYTLSKLLGKENITGQSLQKIAQNNYASSNLYAKHANFKDELSETDVSSTGNFKEVCGGGLLTAEYKFGLTFSFENYAKLFFACNKIPEVEEANDPAYYARWIVIRFLNKVEKKITNLNEKMTTQDELSGLFNWAIIGLKRLLDNDKFSNEKGHEDTRTMMMLSSSSIANFVSACLYRKDGNVISRDEVYSYYSEYCLKNGINTENNKKFGHRFATYAIYSSDVQQEDWSSGKRQSVRAWRNVGVKGVQEKVKTDLELSMEKEVANF